MIPLQYGLYCSRQGYVLAETGSLVVQEAEDIAQAVNRVITLMNLPAACTTPQSSTFDSDDSLLLEDLLNVLGISSACEALRDKGLTLSRLKCMSAMQVMQQGVVSFHDLEALMDALHSL